MLGEGDRRQVEQGGDLLGHRAGVAVGRLGGGQDQVGALDPLDGRGEHLGGVERAGALEGVVAHEDGLGRAHGERGAQAADLAVRRHGDEGDLTPAGRVDELERHLDAVGVGLVEDELAVPLQGVVRVEGTGLGGIRDLLDADDHVHGGGFCRHPTRSANPTYRPRLRSGRTTVTSLKVLLLVNSSASSVTARGRVVIQKALSADHDVTLAETSRRGHATRLAQGAAADGVDVVVVLGGDGTLNEAANGLAGTSSALAALPGGSTNVFARTIGLPNDPIEATG